MLLKKSLLLLFYESCLFGFGLFGCSLLLQLHLSLHLVNFKLLLPEALDLSFVFLLPHASSLRIHLLESFVLGELLHQLAFEFFLHLLLFFLFDGLEADLVLSGGLQLLTHSESLLSLGTFLGLGCLL